MVADESSEAKISSVPRWAWMILILTVSVLVAVGISLLMGDSKGKEAGGQSQAQATCSPQRFELNEPGEWMLTVTNVDTVTWKPATYKLWANKPYRVMSSDPETGKRLEAKMPKTAMYWYGARADFGVGHLWMAAIDSGTVVMVQRVQRVM